MGTYEHGLLLFPSARIFSYLTAFKETAVPQRLIAKWYISKSVSTLSRAHTRFLYKQFKPFSEIQMYMFTLGLKMDNITV